MLLKFPESNAIKFLLIFFITVCYGNVYPQTSQENSLKRKSEELLERKISLQWTGGSLPELLKELSSKEHLNISFSREKTNHITIGNQNVENENISTFLTRILINSGYTYIVIGKTIAIVEDKKQLQKESFYTNDSVRLAASPDTSDNIQKHYPHIYPDTSVEAHLPYHIRKELRKIYRKELSLARKHPEDSSGQDVATETLKKQIPAGKSQLKSGFYLSAHAGLAIFKMRHQSYFPNWKESLDFKNKTRNSFSALINGGYIHRNFLVETGIRFYKMKNENSYVEKSKKMKAHVFPEEYAVFTIPVNISYYKRINKFLLGAGPGIDLSYIKSNVKKNKMKPYYDELKGPGKGKEKYTESTRKIVPGINVKFLAGYTITENWTAVGNLFLNIPLRAYHSNSVYNLYPNTLGIQVGLTYFFSNR